MLGHISPQATGKGNVPLLESDWPETIPLMIMYRLVRNKKYQRDWINSVVVAVSYS